MKELYENLDLEVIRFRTEDIITTSDTKTDQENTKVPVSVPQTDGTDGGGSETSGDPPKYVLVSTETVEGLEGYGPLDIYRLYGESDDHCYVWIDGVRIGVYNTGDHYKGSL